MFQQQPMIYERLIVYVSVHLAVFPTIHCSVDKFKETLGKWQRSGTTNLLRNHRQIQKQLVNPLAHRLVDMDRDSHLRGLLNLDLTALLGVLEAQITDTAGYEDLVDTKGPGAQVLVDLLHMRLSFPTVHKRLYLTALTHLTEKSGLYPMSLTLAKVEPERGRRAGGGFGDIFKGRCFSEEVALKVLRLSLPSGVDSLNSWRSSDGRAQEYLSEVLIWRQLSHPNILPFYGVHFLDTPLDVKVCLVCPWMENGNVVEFLDRRNRMAPETDTTDCISLAFDIAEGLKSENIIHKDLKGYNILISPSMRACIADFGLSTITDSGAATTMVGSMMIGTMRWIAPELFPSGQQDVPVSRYHTFASDIYVFALVCYEADDELMRRVERGVPPSLPLDFVLRVRGGERPSLPSDELSRRHSLTSEMVDCWAGDPTTRPTAEQVEERLHVLCKLKQPPDDSPLDKMAASFHAKALHEQDDPFVILMSQVPG